MLRRLHDDLMCADPVHAIVQPVAGSPEIAFHPKRRELVRDHANAPFGPAVGPIGQNFGRSPIFIARAERTDGHSFGADWVADEIPRASGAIAGADHPAPGNGILADLRKRAHFSGYSCSRHDSLLSNLDGRLYLYNRTTLTFSAAEIRPCNGLPGAAS